MWIINGVAVTDPYETISLNEQDNTKEPDKTLHTGVEDGTSRDNSSWWDNSSWDNSWWDKTWHRKDEDGTELPYHRWRKKDDGYRWHEKQDWSVDDNENPSRWKRKRYSESWHNGGHEKEMKRQMEKKERKFRKDLAAMTGTTLKPQQPSYPPPPPAKAMPLLVPPPQPLLVPPPQPLEPPHDNTLADDDGGDIRAALSQKLTNILIGGGSSSSSSSSMTVALTTSSSATSNIGGGSSSSTTIQTAVALLTSTMEREKLKTELEQTQQELKKYKSKEQIAALVSQLHALQD